jgi:hypothetical protein
MAFQDIQAPLPAQAAAGATTETIVGVVPGTFAEPAYLLQSLSVASPSLVTGVTTNTATINFRSYRAGVLTGNPLGTLALITGVNLPALREVQVPISSANTYLQAGDVITAQLVQGGTGLALPAAMMAKAEVV